MGNKKQVFTKLGATALEATSESYMDDLADAVRALNAGLAEGTPEELRALQRTLARVVRDASQLVVSLSSAIDGATWERAARNLSSADTDG